MILRLMLVLGVYRFRSVIFLFFSENYHTCLPIFLQIFQKNLQAIFFTDIVPYICKSKWASRFSRTDLYLYLVTTMMIQIQNLHLSISTYVESYRKSQNQNFKKVYITTISPWSSHYRNRKINLVRRKKFELQHDVRIMYQ